jgi:hypothetical protein
MSQNQKSPADRSYSSFIPPRRSHDLHPSSFRLAFLLTALLPSIAAAADRYALEEPFSQTQIDSVKIHVTVSGTAEFALEKGKVLAHPITADAQLKYRERRLTGAGRDAEALRSLRRYETAQVQIRVADRATSSVLPADRRLIVADGRREGVLLYSPIGSLDDSELELLRAPADSLCLLALLPPKPVAIGEKWNPGGWVGQMLTDTETASKSEITCTLELVHNGQAKVNFEGTVEGATAGAAGTVSLRGSYLFAIDARRLVRADIEQSEKRTIGPVSPGMKVVAKAVVERTPSDDANGLSAEAATAVPFDPSPSLLRLRFHAPWTVEFDHDRDWHVFQQSSELGVLRLVDKGSFVAQCNLVPLRPAAPGEHVPEQQFQADIRTSLGERLKSIETAESIPTGDGRFLYRVVVAGKSNDIPITWIYYLCAAPSGAQVSFVFAVETSLRSRLADRDLQILKSVRFPQPPTHQ